ncbi:MAG: type I phosphomannose isomerase catalytic subunit [Chloroflexota bacterium]
MLDNALYPLTFTPQLRDYVWGGRNLEQLYDRTLPPGITAESWEISGHPNAPTIVDQGALKGQSLPQVLEDFGEALVGSRAEWALARNKFPLLIKLLDANQSLSVQVHPNDAYGLAHEGGELGKTEMWYVLHAEPDAKVVFGVKSGVTSEGFARAIAENRLETQLHYQPIKAGDAIFVEAGSVHALLEGAVIAEIQQNSDITYRVYDWGRLGNEGKPRELHVKKALEVINFSQVEPGPYQPQQIESTPDISRSEISRCDYFVVEVVCLKKGSTFQGCTTGESLEIWGTTEGISRVHHSQQSIPLPAIRFALIPATLGEFTIQAETDCVLLRTYLP